MRRIFQFLLLTILVPGLLACASALEGGKDVKVGRNTAVMLVGTRGDHVWKEIEEAGVNVFANIPDYTLKGEANDVYAIPVPVGKNFGIKSVSDGLAYAQFKNAHRVRAERAAIYYYGTVVTRFRRVSLVATPDPQVIAMARSKYPGLFAQLQPANF